MPPRYCCWCVLPDTRPGVSLDDDGVCAACRQADADRHVDWSKRQREFTELAREAGSRGADYDCVVPVSGGEDSFWQLRTCLDHGLHPLCVTYVSPGRTELGERNLRRLVALGVDHLELRVNPHVERRFLAKVFFATGTTELVARMAVGAWPLRVAVSRGIPLVVYGARSSSPDASEHGDAPAVPVGGRTPARLGATAATTAADWVGDDLSERDLTPFTRPGDDLLEQAGVRSVVLGDSFPWDPERSRAIAQEHGFESRADAPAGHYDAVSVHDDMVGVRHHAKWHKFGITRSWETLSVEIRHGRLHRDRVIDMLRERGEETPWPDIGAFCDYLGINPRTYFETLERFRNREIWSRTAGRWRIEGFLVPDFRWPEDPLVTP